MVNHDVSAESDFRRALLGEGSCKVLLEEAALGGEGILRVPSAEGGNMLLLRLVTVASRHKQKSPKGGVATTQTKLICSNWGVDDPPLIDHYRERGEEGDVTRLAASRLYLSH